MIGALLPGKVVVVLEKIRLEVTTPSNLAPFVSWVWTVIVVIAIVAPARSVCPQALEPRSYVNTPVGINFLLGGYGYTEGNVAFEASSPIKDAKVHVTHRGAVDESLSVDQILRQQRRLQPQRRRLLGDRDRLAIPLEIGRAHV